MGPISAVSTAFAKVFNFTGRASRSEYWWYFLFGFIVSTAAFLFDASIIVTKVHEVGELAFNEIGFFDLFSPWICLVISIPMISLSVRRLHDGGFSGFWFLLSFVPLGGLVLIVLYILPSQNSTTAHGTPAGTPVKDSSGKPVTVDAHKRAMQGYAVLFDKDKKVTPQMQAARKAEISDYYRSKVLKPAAQV